jgi:hypothetical protein
MVRAVDLFQAPARYLGIDLRRGQIGMAEQGLDGAQIGATIE